MTTRTRTCQVIKLEAGFDSKQAVTYFGGISAHNTGTQGICLHLTTIPPGGRAKSHLHENHETAIYIPQGWGGMWYGDNLSEHLMVKAGEYPYIPASMPHLPHNPSDAEPIIALVARTDANEQKSVVLLPDLDTVDAE